MLLRDFGVVLSYLHWTGERLVLAADNAADLPKVEQFRPLEDWNIAVFFRSLTFLCRALQRFQGVY